MIELILSLNVAREVSVSTRIDIGQSRWPIISYNRETRLCLSALFVYVYWGSKLTKFFLLQLSELFIISQVEVILYSVDASRKKENTEISKLA